MIDYGYGVSLRPIDDCQMLREWRNDPEIRRWCREYRLITKNMQNQWLNNLDEQNLMFSVCVEKDFSEHCGMNVGATGLTGINNVHGTAEFSIYIAPEYQQNRYAEYALQTLIKYGFDECNLNRIWGETFEGNPGMKLYDKLGMKREGVLREAYYKNGEYQDSFIYSILKCEYTVAKNIVKK